MKRRDWLKATTLSLGSLLLPGRASQRDSVKPRGVILMVSDGMSHEVPTLAEALAQELSRPSTAWMSMLQNQQVTQGLFDMSSLNSLVTDSAAAASSWGSGRRVVNGAINEYPDGTVLSPLIPLLKQKGWRTGLVTTARVTHATPAGFAAHVPHRDSEDDIAAQYLDCVDVLLGGGSVYFDADYRNDGRNLRAEFQNRGHRILKNRADLLKSGTASQLLGLFGADHLPYTLDWKAEARLQKEVPTLGEMSAAALRAIGPRDSFFLMIEGARIDHAAHVNDAAALLHDQLAFDDAVRTVVEFCSRNPDVLLVVTTDHGNSNPGLNGMGAAYTASTSAFRRLTESRESFQHLSERLQARQRVDKTFSAEVLATEIKKATGFLPNAEEIAVLWQAWTGKYSPIGNRQHASLHGLLGGLLANYHGIGWTGTTHTADWTSCLACGPGREQFQGLHPNTHFFDVVCELAGLQSPNPVYRGKPLKPVPAPEAHARADASA